MSGHNRLFSLKQKGWKAVLSKCFTSGHNCLKLRGRSDIFFEILLFRCRLGNRSWSCTFCIRISLKPTILNICVIFSTLYIPIVLLFNPSTLQTSSQMDSMEHTYTHTHTHTQTHTQTHTLTHRHTHAHRHTHTPSHTHTHFFTWTCQHQRLEKSADQLQTNKHLTEIKNLLNRSILI